MVDHQHRVRAVQGRSDDYDAGDDLVEEMNFILEEQHKPFAEQGVDFRKQTVFMEILVAVDDDPGKTWERMRPPARPLSTTSATTSKG